MLRTLFPTTHVRYSSLSILGGSLDGLCAWMHAQGYPNEALRRRVRAAVPLERAFHRKGVRSLGELTASTLNSYAPRSRKSSGRLLGAMVRSLTRYLEERGELAPTPPTPTQLRVTAYRHHLERVRGLASSTITLQIATVKKFLLFLDYDAQPQRLRALRSADVEAFVAKVSHRVGRGRLSNVTSAPTCLPSLPRRHRRGPAGLDGRSSRPVSTGASGFLAPFRGRRSARSWSHRPRTRPRDGATTRYSCSSPPTACAPVRSVRCLDDVAWRVVKSGSRPKIGRAPRPSADRRGGDRAFGLRARAGRLTSRQLFLRVEFPSVLSGPARLGRFPRGRGAPRYLFPPAADLTACATLALHLLREGAALKTIGDLLGHRSTESTGVYLRLDVDDLRDVALPLPSKCCGKRGAAMSPPVKFTSAIGPVIARFVARKQALGHCYDTQRQCLVPLDRFLAHAPISDLTAESFSAWCSAIGHLVPSGRRMRMQLVRQLCLYRRRSEPACFVPDPSQFPPPRPRPLPHVFSENEIVRLLRAADALRPWGASPLYRQVARLALVLLYTSGLRRGEVVRLTLGDYDPVEHVISVRDTKFHKSRHGPAFQGCREGDRAIPRFTAVGMEFRNGADAPRLLPRPTGYSGDGLRVLMRHLFRTADVRTAAGGLPRVHDLRFTFAFHALLRWYRAGADVQARLPALAIYMGHVSILSTQYYLPVLDVVAQEASEKFDRHCARFLTTALDKRGGR